MRWDFPSSLATGRLSLAAKGEGLFPSFSYRKRYTREGLFSLFELLDGGRGQSAPDFRDPGVYFLLFILQVPHVGLNFAVYESLKEWLVQSNTFRHGEDQELGVVTKLACGAAVGMVGQTVAYPLDVVRRRMQIVGWKDAGTVVTGDGRVKSPLFYSGMIDAFTKQFVARALEHYTKALFQIQ